MGFLEKSIKKKFRYKVISEIIYTNKELMDFLNDQGDIGWEAVNVESSDFKDVKGKRCLHCTIVFKSSYK